MLTKIAVIPIVTDFQQNLVTIPVEFTAMPHNMVLVGEKISEVKLHLAGSKPDLDSLTPGQITVNIDLSMAMPCVQDVVIIS